MDDLDLVSQTRAAGQVPGPRTEDRPEPPQPPGEHGGVARPDATADFIRNDTMSQAPSLLREPPAELGRFDYLDPPRAPDELGWLANYRVRRLLGEGGMGLVFHAEDADLLRPVALKVIRPELAGSPQAAQRFLLEARAMAALKHDHVVTIYQVGQQRGVPFLAMEYLQGMSLYRWLERGHKPALDLVLRLGREIAAGLAAAHQRRLIHRDIKPANIWLEAPQGGSRSWTSGWPEPRATTYRLPIRGRPWVLRRTWPLSRPGTEEVMLPATCSASVACCTNSAPAGCHSRGRPSWPC